MYLLISYLACACGAALLALWRVPRMPCSLLLLAIAAVPQLGAILGIRIPGMFLVSAVALVAWLLRNRSIAGVPTVAAGSLLNLLPMALHGGAMPVHPETLLALGRVATPGTLLGGSKDIVAASPLWLLSDWLIVPIDGWRIVASPGDLIVCIGVVWWLLYSRHPKEERSNVDIVGYPSFS